ncbi:MULTISPECIES: DUF3299 domain-containing protein [Hyphomonas]|jgi:hypothetical protein|uniref:DUF3299 domain-containing protein n=1 Tax=Hyphomonas adhaerens TaxID=81029 RepID=A0A3B9H1X0_9PROT|nr:MULTISPECIES: DUF3299 domain-containing protein [Hyphomonas]MAB09730.1 hypothetical protein [Hyphomonas sp.]MBB39704.1 hypothetical protein [Hyphomonas sp.]HAE28264.1 DUF3299 domain-containing protein [Hyphomonas adhaerens]|tara:strand:+ start:128 stop:838 length:711 start_codon:yes stop_codon:yes gene_type:complete
MKRSLLLPALVLISLSPACGQTTAPAADAETPAEASVETSADASTAPAGPQVGDKIGESDAEKAAKDASVAAAAAEAMREQEEIKARGVTEIGWEDLMPEGEEERLQKMYAAQMATLYSIQEGSAADTAVQIGSFNTVDTYDGKKIRMPGYTVPFSYDAKAEISEFLLVPYFGACIHAPPPPPNQTIFVRTDDPILLKDLPQAVWIEGTLHAQKQESDLADAAYIIDLSRVEKYEY